MPEVVDWTLLTPVLSFSSFDRVAISKNLCLTKFIPFFWLLMVEVSDERADKFR